MLIDCESWMKLKPIIFRIAMIDPTPGRNRNVGSEKCPEHLTIIIKKSLRTNLDDFRHLHCRESADF
jgi:hypothetical protein